LVDDRGEKSLSNADHFNQEYPRVAERTTPGIKIALTIAESDPSGGAGIQADLKTFAIMGVYGCAAVTTVTVQNTTGVKDCLPLTPEWIDQQIAAVANDLRVDAVKTGMISNAESVIAVAKAVKRHNLAPLIVDPVMTTKNSGNVLLNDAAIAALCKHLLPLAAVVTPNKTEAARMLGKTDPITYIYQAGEAAKEICRRYGAKACIVTGIKRADNPQQPQSVDLYFDGANLQELSGEWRPTQNLHGAGSTFSAAITAGLALGQPIDQAIKTAKAVSIEAIRQTTDLGHGTGPVNHLAYAKVTQK
jgi:hydroxymethylpyrimidine/phosphomethylpyrimidine kinase